MTDISVAWLKWPHTPYRTTPMRAVAHDEHGTWLHAPSGTVSTYAAAGPVTLPVNFLTLIPNGGQWWIATWMSRNDDVDIALYVDIVHPPIVDEAGGVVRVVDLDLDVIVRWNGLVLVDDEDEFRANAVSLDYPTDVVHRARAAADAVVAAINIGKPPFDRIDRALTETDTAR